MNGKIGMKTSRRPSKNASGNCDSGGFSRGTACRARNLILLGRSPLLQRGELDFSPAKMRAQKNWALALGFFLARQTIEFYELAE